MLFNVASGKGGTGKTTVAANLAAVIARGDIPVCFADCDTEAPNGHIFLKPKITGKEMFGMPVPVVDGERCDGCRLCSEACRFNAIAVAGGKVVTFPEMCHSCGGCTLVCPRGAILESERELGVIERGWAGPISFVQGRLTVGENRSSPLVAGVKGQLPENGISIIDTPPGTSCPVIESVRGSDMVILVTEPTPFGLHDLQLAVEMVKELDRPSGVVINRCDIGDDRVDLFCEEQGLPVLTRIPHDRRIAESYSRGELIIAVDRRFEKLFQHLAERVTSLPGREDLRDESSE